MCNNNLLIREALFRTGVKKWQLAKLMGISEPTLYRMLRENLPEDKQMEIVNLINQETEMPFNEFSKV